MAEDYVVQQGDSILSIATERGFFWETIWNDGSNAQLKALRKNPDILMPGDVVHIPDLQIKEESGATDQRHPFKTKLPAAKFVLTLLTTPKPKKDPNEGQAADFSTYEDPDPPDVKDEPLKNAPYHLYAGATLVAEGNTDGNGGLNAALSPVAQGGALVLDRGTAKERTILLNFRHMDPIGELSGVCKRLYNMGYVCPTDAASVTPDVAAALREFQRRNALTVNGTLDDATRNKVQEVYGG